MRYRPVGSDLGLLGQHPVEVFMAEGSVEVSSGRREDAALDEQVEDGLGGASAIAKRSIGCLNHG
ncbi:hypothetical protein FNYG_09989 [Fusarium nygamai]|uniref:Uncharacterized protein n=1 Tax=Gibberella nygamai TaxID=42673 RepID=A0A2K0W2R6_GIBNY|nr:hypothetical protein FNYG_09989 [Fusarium nygamai]